MYLAIITSVYQYHMILEVEAMARSLDRSMKRLDETVKQIGAHPAARARVADPAQ